MSAQDITPSHLTRDSVPAEVLDRSCCQACREELEAMWKADDEYCKSVIVMNVSPDVFSIKENAHRHSAAALWFWLRVTYDKLATYGEGVREGAGRLREQEESEVKGPARGMRGRARGVVAGSLVLLAGIILYFCKK